MFQVRTRKLFMFWGFESHINEATSDFFLAGLEVDLFFELGHSCFCH